MSEPTDTRRQSAPLWLAVAALQVATVAGLTFAWDDDVDSAGGLLTKTLGRLPDAGSSVGVSGIRLRAERVEGRRRLLRTIVVQADPSLLDARRAYGGREVDV